MKYLIALLFLLASPLHAQTTLPAVTLGVPWPTTIPSVPEIPRPAVDYTVTISSAGNDGTGDGTISHPVASLNRAITIAQQHGAKLPLFQLAGTFTTWQSVNFPNGGNAFANGVVIDGVPGVSYPVIMASDNAINFLRVSNVQVRHLIIQPTVMGKQAALYFDSCPNTLIDRCKFYGFCFGTTHVGTGNSNLQIYRTGYLYQDSGSTNDSSGLYTQGIPAGDTAQIGGCTFLRCGLPIGYVYGANPAFDNTLGRKHAIYGNESPQGIYGQVHVYGCIFVDAASRGIGSRRDGLYEWNVYRSNGTATDINEGNAGSPIGTGIVQDSIVFGPGIDGPPFWGGGFECYSVNVIARRLYAFSNSTSQLNPLLTIGWDATPTTAAPAGHGPFPSNTTASVDNVHGIWPKSPLATNGGRQQPSPTNMDVRLPKAGEKVPSLAAYYGVPESGLYAVLDAHCGQVDAPAVVAWGAAAWTTINGPVVTPPIPPLPTVLGTGITSGGVPFQVIQKP